VPLGGLTSAKGDGQEEEPEGEGEPTPATTRAADEEGETDTRCMITVADSKGTRVEGRGGLAEPLEVRLTAA
jgi:hypothetical protein